MLTVPSSRAPGARGAPLRVRLAAVLLVAGACTGCSGPRESGSGPVAEGPPGDSAGGERAPTRAVFLGDSYTVASGIGTGYASRTAAAMGWTPVLEAAGGTGYVAAGDGTVGPYAGRVDEVVADDPDVLLVQGSTNDVGSPVAAVAEAADELYAELARRLPGAQVVVLGPLAPPGVDRAGVLAVRDALADAADDAGIPYIDPIADGWLTPADGLYGDPIHPNEAGHAELADDLAEALRDAGL